MRFTAFPFPLFHSLFANFEPFGPSTHRPLLSPHTPHPTTANSLPSSLPTQHSALRTLPCPSSPERPASSSASPTTVPTPSTSPSPSSPTAPAAPSPTS